MLLEFVIFNYQKLDIIQTQIESYKMKRDFNIESEGNFWTNIGGVQYLAEYSIRSTWSFSGKSKCYVFHKGETILENIQNRHNRPKDFYREILSEMFFTLGYDVRKMTWSQKAGCSCGCSPGFIINFSGDPDKIYEIFVNLSVESDL